MDVDSLSRITVMQNVNTAPRPGALKSETRDRQKSFETNGQIKLDQHPDTANKKVEKSEKSDKNDQQSVSEEEVSKAVKDANRLLRDSKRQLSYSVHEKTNQIMVKIIDTETDEIIREIPPEKTLDTMAKIWELAGLFIDEKR